MSSFCLGCGKSMAAEEKFCPACGRDSQAGPSVPIVDPQVAFGLPPETSGKAIFSLICGILFLFLPFAVVAVVFGYIALSEIRKNPGRLKGKALAVTGIALGYLGIVFIVGVIGLGIYEIRKEERQIAGNKDAVVSLGGSENSVVSSIRSLNMAEIAYGQAHRNVGYTCSLSELRGVWGISSELAAGRKNGYIFELKNCSTLKSGGPVTTYQLVAYSAQHGQGVAAYCTDQSDVIRVVRGGSPEECFKNGRELPAKEVNSQ